MSSPRALLEPYLAERALYVSESTVSGDLFHLKRFFAFLDERGVEHVGAISLEVLEAYRYRLDTVPGKRGTLASGAFKHKALHVPRLFLLWAFREGHTLVDFDSFPLPHRTLPEIVVPTVVQAQKLLEAPSLNSPSGRRDRLVLESFYTLGLRRRESHRLNIDDLDLSRQTVRVMGKRSRERLLPLSSRLCKLFGDYIKQDRPCLRPFPSERALWVSPQNGTRLGHTYLRCIVWRNSEKLGLGRVYPHLLRHACASHMLEAGARLEQIQAFLGHAVPSSTDRYAQVTDSELQEHFKRYHPRAHCARQVEGEAS